MKFILGTILFVAITIWLVSKLIDTVFNIIAILNNKTERHEGMIYNPNTNKLEADSSEILPF